MEVRKGSLGSVTLRTGRYISFAGHDKVYLVDNADDLEFIDTTTARNITFYPALRQDVTVSYIRLNPNIKVRYAPGTEWAYTGSYLFQDTVYLHEVI